MDDNLESDELPNVPYLYNDIHLYEVLWYAMITAASGGWQNDKQILKSVDAWDVGVKTISLWFGKPINEVNELLGKHLVCGDICCFPNEYLGMATELGVADKIPEEVFDEWII